MVCFPPARGGARCRRQGIEPGLYHVGQGALQPRVVFQAGHAAGRPCECGKAHGQEDEGREQLNK